MRAHSGLVAVVCWGMIHGQAAGGEIVKNANDLRSIVLRGHQGVNVVPIALERGCSPTECTVEVGDLSIERIGPLIRTREGEVVRIVSMGQSGGKLHLDLDPEPIAAYQVDVDGRSWGTCLEFTHSGIGKSGRYQRWSSVVLVPRRESAEEGRAFHWVGYWLGCDSMFVGDSSAQVVLTVVEAHGKSGGAFRATTYSCSSARCGDILRVQCAHERHRADEVWLELD